MGNAGSGGNPFVRQTFGSSKWACHTPDKTYAMDLNHTWFARKCGKKGASRPQSAAIYKTFDAGARVQDCQIACQNDARCVAVETWAPEFGGSRLGSDGSRLAESERGACF